MITRKKLGQLMTDAGVIDEMQLKNALSDQQKWGDRLGQTLVKMGFVTEEIMCKALSSQLKIPSVNLAKTDIPDDVFGLIDRETAQKYGVIPVMTKKEGNKQILFLAMSDPTNLKAVDDIQFLTSCVIRPLIALESQIQVAINRCFDGLRHDPYPTDAEKRGKPAPAPAAERPMVVHRRGSKVAHLPSAQGNLGQNLPESLDDAARQDDGRPHPSKEMLALLKLLWKKGIITKHEFIEEFKNL